MANSSWAAARPSGLQAGAGQLEPPGQPGPLEDLAMFVARILPKAELGVFQGLLEVLFFHRPLGVDEYVVGRLAISVFFGLFPHSGDVRVRGWNWNNYTDFQIAANSPFPGKGKKPSGERHTAGKESEQRSYLLGNGVARGDLPRAEALRVVSAAVVHPSPE